jgi:DNA repair exonuclease SbcCD ATPase subunit
VDANAPSINVHRGRPLVVLGEGNYLNLRLVSEVLVGNPVPVQFLHLRNAELATLVKMGMAVKGHRVEHLCVELGPEAAPAFLAQLLTTAAAATAGAAAGDLASLRAQINAAHQELASLEARLGDARQAVETAEQEAATAVREAEKTAHQQIYHISWLLAGLINAHEGMAPLEDAVTRLHAQLLAMAAAGEGEGQAAAKAEALQVLCQRLSEASAASDKVVQDLQDMPHCRDQLDSAAAARGEMQQQLDAAATEHSSLQQQLAVAAAERNEMQQQLAAERNEMQQRLAAERNEMQQQLDAAATERNEMQQRLAAERNEMQQQLDAAAAERNEMQQQLDANKTGNGSLQQQLAAAKERSLMQQEQQRQLADTNAALAKAQEDLKHARDEACKARAFYDRYKQTNEVCVERIEMLKSQTAAAFQQLGTTQQTLADTQQQLTAATAARAAISLEMAGAVQPGNVSVRTPFRTPSPAIPAGHIPHNGSGGGPIGSGGGASGSGGGPIGSGGGASGPPHNGLLAGGSSRALQQFNIFSGDGSGDGTSLMPGTEFDMVCESILPTLGPW